MVTLQAGNYALVGKRSSEDAPDANAMKPYSKRHADYALIPFRLNNGAYDV